MKDQYVALSSDFTLKCSSSASVLFNLRYGAVYELTSDQVELVGLLDGTLTFQQLLDLYEDSSKQAVTQMIKQLKTVSAISYSDEQVQRFIQRTEVPDARLESVHLEASGECNMRCVHCYQARYVESKERLKFLEVLNLLDDLQKMQVSRVSISGGEPLMMPYFNELLPSIEERDMRISALFTNGLLVNEDLVKTIKALRSRFSFFISLDSLPSSTLSFRGFTGESARKALERVVEGIALLTSNDISVVVNTVVNTENLGHLEEMYDLVGLLKVSSWRLGFPKMTPQFKIHSNEFNVEWMKIAERCFGLLKQHLNLGMPFPIQIEYLFREELFNQGILELSDQDYVCDYEGRRTELCVKPDGNVVSCAYCTDLPIGNIKRTPIWDIWYSSAAKKVKTIKIGEVEQCRNCELRSLCGTGCRANAFFLHGDFKQAKDDYACMAVAFFKERVIPLLQEYGIIKWS